METCVAIFFHLIDGRSRHTDDTKVESHLEDVGPPAIKQNKIAFHHMLANLADVVAEEAAKRLLPDTNLERKAKPSGAHRGLAPMQADFWAKRGEAGDIYELDPPLEEEEVNTRSAIERLVEELAHQGHSQRGRAVPTAS